MRFFSNWNDEISSLFSVIGFFFSTKTMHPNLFLIVYLRKKGLWGVSFCTRIAKMTAHPCCRRSHPPPPAFLQANTPTMATSLSSLSAFLLSEWEEEALPKISSGG